MLLIYTRKITNRVRYVFNLFFNTIIGVNFQLTTNAEEFANYTGPKLNYSLHLFKDELFFQSSNLLFESGIIDQNIRVTEWRGEKIFFTSGKNAVFPFDVFAASFYLVSRYEEYLPHIRDEYDRFEPKESVAFQHNFLEKPVVNTWAAWIKELLLIRYPHLTFNNRKYEFISTIDIDSAYAYREKGFMRTVGGYFKSILKLDFSAISERTKVLMGFKKDPYDTYHYQLELQKKYNVKTIYFFLLGDYGVNDKNLPTESLRFQYLIKMLGDYAPVGIHPSFNSNNNTVQLKREIFRLSKIVHREVTKSRQHFLKLSLPETYRNLIDFDITDDYTMGYASQMGFRAGICTPYNFYDLDNELETKLKIHPFQLSESNLRQLYTKSPAQAVVKMKQMIDEVKKVNGTFISLWRNEAFANSLGGWEGANELYEKMLVEAKIPDSK